MPPGDSISRLVNRLMSRPHLPRRLAETPGDRLLLHVSDTPYEIYGFLRALIRRLQPAIIVHTGDLVDDMKLEYDAQKTQRYAKRAAELIRLLEQPPAADIFITAGNHDNPEILRSLLQRSTILPAGLHTIAGRKVWIDHYGDVRTARAAWDLFGHERHPPSGPTDHGLRLNGLTHANIIDVSVARVYHVEYPMDVDRYRRLERSRQGM